MIRHTLTFLAAVTLFGLHVGAGESKAQEQRSSAELPAPIVQELIGNSCLNCHNSGEPAAGIDLESITAGAIEANREVWEKVVRMLRLRQMPPFDMPRPEEATYNAALRSLAPTLDDIAARHPQPGRTDTFRRLTRTEYRNAVRDLLAVDVDVSALLPEDEVSHGFDNITVGELSPTLLNRYISAAQKISRLALGGSQHSPGGTTIRVRPDVTQEERVEGLPIGTRGGTLISYHFPQDGEYEIQIRLARDRDEHVEGLTKPHELELLLDLERVKLFTVNPPRGNAGSAGAYGRQSHDHVDQHLTARLDVTAGTHQVGVTFLKNSSSLLEYARQPLNVHFNMYRHPRLGPAVYQVSIAGPFRANGPGNTASRKRIFVTQPTGPEDEDECARKIVASLLRRACRQPITDEDLSKPMALYREARAAGNFKEGLEVAISAILLNPKFLFRIERDASGIPPGTAYQVSDVELASRLSFFLWSSIPDDELLQLAERGQLSDSEVLEQQTRRMLADDRSQSLASNFAGQWLHLRNLESTTPDARLYPDFDDNLRQAFREETERLFGAIMNEDRSVLELLTSDYTYLNERLAKHYGVPHVYGSRFRRVSLEENSHRGGLLRHGSILTVTSYATRTSPVLRGKWILENILGTRLPPPPDNVPAIEESTVASELTGRERLAQHRADPACASCHNLIDPVGFSMESFDAVGRWRELDEGQLVDASGSLPYGDVFSGVDGLEQRLLDRPDLFVSTMAEKLLTFAIGRGAEPHDAPEIRKIVRDAKDEGYRFSSLILGVVNSVPFQMRTSQ
ncbi:MAG: DUF1592 domain-containing protein [Planctomycetaceae bacterium]|nr:DUF1592 domain-containing protein [Planctomycetales bacterium]MCB9926685.1 DUF1592 domain-containing protein [Planctomycetaceae bacterium]